MMKTKHILALLLSTTILTSVANAQQVTGVAGCITTLGVSIHSVDAGDVSTAVANYGCPTDASQSGPGYGGMISDKFVTAGELNPILSDIYSQLGGGSGGGGLTSVVTDGVTIVGDGTTANPVKLADSVTSQINTNTTNISALDGRVTNIDARVTQNTTDITNLDARVTQNTTDITNLDNRVTNVDARVTQNSTDITELQNWQNNVDNGGGIKYFHANSTLVDSQATGQDSIAIGGNALASGKEAIATGANAVASADASTALGGNAQATAVGATALGHGAIASHNNSVAIGAGSATDRANSVSVGNASQTRQITSVSAGTVDTDAVNLSQLRGALDGLGGGTTIDNSTGKVIGPKYVINGGTYYNVGDALQAVNQGSRDYTDNRINSLRGYMDNRFASNEAAIRDAKRTAGAAGASGLAAAALRYDDRPGKGSVAGAIGGFKGYTALATGVGYTTENGNTRMNANVSYVPTTGDFGFAAGASWTFN